MKVPPLDVQEKVRNIRIMGMKGIQLPETMLFCEKVWKKYPEWYASIEAEIKEITRPFGSRAEDYDNQQPRKDSGD